MDTIAMYAGYGLITGIGIVILIFALDIEYSYEMYWLFTVFGFGLIGISRYNHIILNDCWKYRGEDAGFGFKKQVIFINAPRWFNQHVWNIGGVKK